MQKLKSKYISEDGFLNESVIEIEFKNGLLLIINSSGSSSAKDGNYQKAIDTYILEFSGKGKQ